MSTDKARARVHRTVEAVWRIEAARLIGGLARRLRDLSLAEELAQEAFLAALEQWPEHGVPDNPGAWLTTTAQNRAIDRQRRHALHARKEPALSQEIEAQMRAAAPEVEAMVDQPLINDDVLRLIFVTCHPVLSPEARVALTLRMVGGLATGEIARAYLAPEATIAQRIVRAKRSLGQAGIPFELPPAEQLAARLASVLEVVYLIFNEGYAATTGADWTRPALCEEALRLGRILAGLAPQAAEVHGLLALMELQASRLPARVAADGTPILLPDQDRRRWSPLLIRRGLAALARAEALGGADGRYALQAAIAACHARAATAVDTDWPRIAGLYARLAQLCPSPVIELNRAVAVAMAQGPAAGLALVDALKDDPVLAGYHLLPSVRGDFLLKLGRSPEAAAEFRRAAALAGNDRERALLEARAATAALPSTLH